VGWITTARKDSNVDRTKLIRYGTVVSSVAIATILTWVLQPVMGRAIFALFYAAVAISSRVGGIVPGLFSALLSTLAINFFFVDPVYSFGFRTFGDFIQVALFAVVALVIGSINNELIAAKQRTETALARLQISEGRYRRLIDTAHEGILTLDVDGRINYVNEQLAQMLGYRAEELMGQSLFDLLMDPEREHAQSNLDCLSEGLRWQGDYSLRRKTGSTLWCMVSTSPIADDHGDFQETLVMITDVSDRKTAELDLQQLNATLEQRVHERTAQLEAANKELEAFSYSVSHDLRAPFRHIVGFVQLLQKRLATTELDDTSQRYLKTIADTAQRAGKLVDDLLAFSRIGRAEIHCKMVDLNQLVQEVVRDLEPDFKERRIHWQIHPLPPVKGDPTLLRLAWQNLIENATKYTRSRSEAIIEIGSFEQDQSLVCFVRDNGVGFDMQYVSKLFGVFQRLHNDPEFEGTGIGLAHVRRIIHRHGGQTWAEGQEGQGATFYFSLPR
jgi:PAS domain S-box-containing protein